jgi:secreted trypsin-like serine protease
MKKMIFCSLIFALLAGCSNDQSTDFIDFNGSVDAKIVNGDDTSVRQHPWQLSLNLGWHHFCGGVLIAPDLVLTAAHCLEGQSHFMVSGGGREGSGHRSDLIRLPRVKGWRMHPSYGQGLFDFGRDIGIVVLEESVDFQKNPHLKMISLEDSLSVFDYLHEIQDGELLATGWGRADFSDSPQQLQQANLSFASHDDILEAFERLPEEEEQEYTPEELAMFEEIEKGFWNAVDKAELVGVVDESGAQVEGELSNSCFGDSGGPLVHIDQQGQAKLIGVTSIGFGFCGNISFYTAFKPHMNWIHQAADELRAGL